MGQDKKKIKLKLFAQGVSAGFPSPADDYIDKNLDLNEYMIKHPAATYLIKVVGNSMIDAGISTGDILIVDRSIEPADSKIVVAVINGEFTLKRFRKIDNKIFLYPENSSFKPIEIKEEMECQIWGVVTFVIHSFENYMPRAFALIDRNNFYVSCEQVFNPKLRNRAVVVLSNNDGCVISRSQEAKSIGIEMGQPIFKCKEIVDKYKIQVLSSNFCLYGDMSNRVMSVISNLCPDFEIYSIDEAFIVFQYDRNFDIDFYLSGIRKTIYRWTGIPVSIGSGTTKTLAKAANKIAKRKRELNGVFNLITNDTEIDKYLKEINVSDIWGIGYSFSKLLKKHNINNAKELKNIPDSWIREHLKTPGLKTIHELRGIPCIIIEEANKPKKNIITSRTFGKDVESLNELNEAISSFVTNAAEKLRRQRSVASFVYIYIMSNPFKECERYYNSIVAYPSIPTANSLELIKYSLIGLNKIYKNKIKYKKAGIMLSGIIPELDAKSNLFSEPYPDSRDEGLMKVMDKINTIYGRDMIYPLSNGIKNSWGMRQLRKSPRYTTKFEELLTIKI